MAKRQIPRQKPKFRGSAQNSAENWALFIRQPWEPVTTSSIVKWWTWAIFFVRKSFVQLSLDRNFLLGPRFLLCWVHHCLNNYQRTKTCSTIISCVSISMFDLCVIVLCCLVPSWSYPSTLEDSHNEPRSCRSHSCCLQCSHPRVFDGWGT